MLHPPQSTPHHAAPKVCMCLQVALANNETESQIEDKLAGLCDSLSFLGSSQAVVDCDKLSELPDISFTIAGKEFGLTPEQYILKVSWQGLFDFGLSGGLRY